MRYFVELGLFENADGVITCLKLARRLDKSMTSNNEMRTLIENMRNHDGVMTKSEKPMKEEKRLDKNRGEYKDIVEQARLCLEYLNEVTGSKYKHTTKSHIQNITARISDGFTSDDIKMVVDAKSAEWGNDEKMCQYLRPSTLFSAKNFNGYLAAAKSKPNTDFRNPTKTQDYSKGW